MNKPTRCYACLLPALGTCDRTHAPEARVVPACARHADTKPVGAKDPVLSDAQLRALGNIAQHGGHGFGAYAYLPARTAEALARLGCVVLGYVQRYDSRRGGYTLRSWAVAVYGERPDGFRTREEVSAENDAAMVEINARIAAAEGRRNERRAALLDFARRTPRPGETPAEHAERVTRVEAALKTANDATLDAAEAAAQARVVSNAAVARQDSEGSTR